MKAANETIRQSSFARQLMLALLLAAAVIAMPVMQGCTTLGTQQPQSFSQRYTYAIAQTTALREASAVAFKSNQISAGDADYAAKLTDQSRSLLDSALAVHSAGRIDEAQGRLALVTGILTELQTYLSARAAK